jgi:hypothetical protein
MALGVVNNYFHQCPNRDDHDVLRITDAPACADRESSGRVHE